MLKLTRITLLLLLFSLPLLHGFCQVKLAPVPEIIIPVYDKVRDLKLKIPLTIDGKPSCSIATPAIYDKDAEMIQVAIEKKTGVRIPVVRDTDESAMTPLKGNLIILGNRSTSKVSSELYDRYYSLMDLKYPGPGGYSVRTLHNPYGNGFSAVLVGGSDPEGISEGTAAFVASLTSLEASSGNMSVGWTMLTKLGKGVNIPTDLKDFETWEASKGYGSIGYFGWNSISKRMAMYYMTGDPFQAQEFLRLSFPDSMAIKEFDAIDGERIENKKDPLAGPYHYNSMMLILYWDLIEESPVFSDAQRLKITNAFARRLDHEGTHPFDKMTYQLNEVPAFVGSRHIQWCALPVYTLGRYFNKYYPSPMWAQCERAGKLAFASLHEHEWVESGADCSGIAPVLTYMILSGDMVPLKNGVLAKLLPRMEILMTGLKPDKALNYAALDFLNKAAYLTGDGRWITYCEMTGLNTDIFRLGQSFWPDKSIKPGLPDNYFGKWMIYTMPKPMWEKRGTGFRLEQSFLNMSYRNTLDAEGDYVLIDGYNEAYRNPYHNYDIIELRLNGSTVMRGFSNQVYTSVDGMVEPRVPMDGALLHNDVVGQVAEVTGEVSTMPYAGWKRSLVLRTGKYALIADEITFRGEKTLRVETNWEMPGAEWNSEGRYIKINSEKKDPSVSYELHSSDMMDVRGTDVKGSGVTSMIWKGASKEGQKRTFFHLIGQNRNKALSNSKLDDHAAALALPEAALAVSGNYKSIQGELVLLSERTLFGHGLNSASINGQTILNTDSPIEVDWDFENGRLSIVNSKTVKLTIALGNQALMLDGHSENAMAGKTAFTLNLTAGRHEISGAKLSPAAGKLISVELIKLQKTALQLRTQQLKQNSLVIKKTYPVLTSVMKKNIGGSPVESVVMASSKGDLLGIAAGKQITVLDSKGSQIWKTDVPGDIRVLHWWPEQKLLIAGCSDEKVMAFDEQGNKKWEFTSVMDPGVYEAAKTYWFKSAYPGIYGMNSGIFDQGKSRLFIGSACTVEILDENGELVKRLPVFWGPGRHFLFVDAADGSRNVLQDRWNNDFVDMIILNSKKMKEIGRGYDEVPAGHTFIDGWDAMSRSDNFLTDLDGDGKKEVVSSINGLWNRIGIYTEDGKPLYNAQFGPGLKGMHTNMRMVDIGDLAGDGKQEIVIGHSAGYVTVLDAQAKKLWATAFASPPMVVKIVKQKNLTWLCVGLEDGTIVALDTKGTVLKENSIAGKPVGLQILENNGEPLAIILAENGEISAFKY